MAKRSDRIKKSTQRRKRVSKKKTSKTKNYSRKRFYKRSKRLMRGGWGGGGRDLKHKIGGYHHGQHGGNPHVGGWGS